MPTARTQEKRTIAIATSLGDDKLLLVGMHGSEALGRLFQYELDLMSEGVPVDYKKVLGQNITIKLTMFDNKERYFNGYISKFSLVSMDEPGQDRKKVFYYRATLVPTQWFLTRSADCRIFQEKTVRQIIEQLLGDRSMSNFEFNLSGTYRKWEYCVQYRETDFNFISRLMENEGMYYYFKHENGKHTMMIVDAPSAHDAADGYTELHFDEPDLDSGHDAYLWDWVLGHEITPNQYALTDYDPLQPQAQQEKVVNIEHTHDPDTYEIFDYPGGYVDPAEGRIYTNMRLEELEARYEVGHGTSSARGIFAGCTYKLVDHPGQDEAEYLITQVSYQIRNEDMGAGMGRQVSSDGGFECRVTCIPKGYEFRAPRVTPKPIVQGPQTAKVVGPKGEEIYTDKYGRVKVHFYWDRAGKEDEKASCFIRVSTPCAGKGWGAVSIPRMGQEVIVEFLEGDPDRPIITGRVYNGDNMPPYELPKNMTMSTFKSNSSKGGAGFNELRFEDKKDSEQIFMWAQKNMDLNVQNDRFETIKHDTHLTVTNNQYLNVKNEVHTKVSSHTFEDVGGDVSVKISGKEAKQVDGSLSLKVGGNVIEEFGANHSSIVSSQLFLKATDVIIEGTSSVSIKVGGTSIAMTSSGITIKTSGDIELKAGGKISDTSGGDTSLTVGGQYGMTSSGGMQLKAGGSAIIQSGGSKQITSGGALVIKGTVVNIN